MTWESDCYERVVKENRTLRHEVRRLKGWHRRWAVKLGYEGVYIRRQEWDAMMSGKPASKVKP